MFGKKDKDTTEIKQKTKIKEKFTVPATDINQGLTNIPTIPTGTMNIPSSQQYSQGSNYPGQGTTISSMPVGSNIGSNVGRNRSSSSSSSSSNEGNRNTGLSSGLAPTGNIQTGYGPTTGYDTTFTNTGVAGSSGLTGISPGSNMPLGKNLYGETGFVTPGYQVQEPFPGQNVYVEKPHQKISKKTK